MEKIEQKNKIIKQKKDRSDNHFTAKNIYPDWALDVKKKYSSSYLRKDNNGAYRLYQNKCYWDKDEKKYKTEKAVFLGTIKQDVGLVTPKLKLDNSKAPAVKNYGATKYMYSISQDIYKNLKECFPSIYKKLYKLSILRTLYLEPLKNIEMRDKRDITNITFGEENLDKNEITKLLSNPEISRENILKFMSKYYANCKEIIFDGTSIVCYSKQVDKAKVGYNHHGSYDPQFNLLCGCDINGFPNYYKLLAGNITDGKAFSHAIRETGLQNVIAIGDKNFLNDDTKRITSDANIKYIIPLKRNSKEISQEKINDSGRDKVDGMFIYEGNAIKYYKKYMNKDQTYTYIFYNTKNTKVEDDTFVHRMEQNNKKYTMDKYKDEKNYFGLLAIKSNVENITEKEIFLYYKKRWQIEKLFHELKNVFEKDKSYMQSTNKLETWCFLNQILMMITFRIYEKLTHDNLLNNYSVNDAIKILHQVQVVKYGTKWVYCELTKKEQDFASKFQIDFTTNPDFNLNC